MKKAKSKTYTKYRTLHLPKEMVDLLFITSHITPLESHPNSIEIGLTVINDILSKSNIYNKDEDFTSHVIPMYSKYLQLKYGNDYSFYINWMVTNFVIWNDKYFKGYSKHFYLNSIEECNKLIDFNASLTVASNLGEGIYNNCCIIAAPKDPVIFDVIHSMIKKCIDLYSLEEDLSGTGIWVIATGPQMYDEVIRKNIGRLSLAKVPVTHCDAFKDTADIVPKPKP